MYMEVLASRMHVVFFRYSVNVITFEAVVPVIGLK